MEIILFAFSWLFVGLVIGIICGKAMKKLSDN